ncbi:MAG: hypothetical protein ACYDCO_07375 [Armatimonadota bacterium]
MTSLSRDEFVALLPAFTQAYNAALATEQAGRLGATAPAVGAKGT